MYFDVSTESFYSNENEIFDMNSMKWSKTSNIPKNLVKYSYIESVRKLQTTKYKIKIPIGVIGTGMPDEDQYQTAVDLGRGLANLGLFVICGGRAGIMEATCKGVSEKNGISIGILPESSIENANEYVSIPLASGIGFARNAIICSSSFCLVAIGGGNGTLCEIAYGLQFKKAIFALRCSLPVNGITQCSTVDHVIERICKLIFKIKDGDDIHVV